jgi:PAS domain S-box-containing protein
VRDGIWQVDAEGTTMVVNHTMAAMLGYTPEEMVGTSVFAYLDDAERARAAARLERRRLGWSEQTDVPLLRKDGTPLLVRLSSNTLTDGAGQFDGVLALVTALAAPTDVVSTETTARSACAAGGIHPAPGDP